MIPARQHSSLHIGKTEVTRASTFKFFDVQKHNSEDACIKTIKSLSNWVQTFYMLTLTLFSAFNNLLTTMAKRPYVVLLSFDPAVLWENSLTITAEYPSRTKVSKKVNKAIKDNSSPWKAYSHSYEEETTIVRNQKPPNCSGTPHLLVLTGAKIHSILLTALIHTLGLIFYCVLVSCLMLLCGFPE